ncbi:peroxisomal targeting signal 2 receptor [Blyttiomyces sp. JEL0837]|nr:peroxisomal targeting signal 2 receptor [Blyttiomyces sp. JEL0837]
MAHQRFRTTGFNGYSVEYSPFFENRLACASAANFGIVGNGRLWILNCDPNGIVAERIYDTQDGLYDSAWSEIHENQIVTSSGDGSLKLWDLSLADFPIRNWAEHTREVFTVNWNLVRKDTFISGSWDQSIKLWSPQSDVSLRTWTEHTHCIYQTVWSAQSPDIFASASGDQTVKVWDVRGPKSVNTFRAHNNEVLALDWNKYNANMVVTGSVDHSIKIWDLRYSSKEIMGFKGHDYAVRRVKCSPHSGAIIASTSYDMTMRLWDMSRGHDNLIHVYDQHTEFVLGVDLNMFFQGRVATCAWDEGVHIQDIPALMPK